MTQERESYKRPRNRNDRGNRPEVDESVKRAIREAEDALIGSMESYAVEGLNGFQRKMVYRHFDRSHEYKAKTYRDGEDFRLTIYPVGALKRYAEQKAQEVLMKGEPEALPPMGSFERFVIHDYLKGRGGVETESYGEGSDRHIEIRPVFGRTLKKAKRRLSR